MEQAEEWVCLGCHKAFPCVVGLPDLRVRSDRYLSLDDDRAKARRLERLACGRTMMETAEVYYAMTPDVDPARRAGFLRHLRRAEWRGAQLAAVLPKRGRILEVGCGSGGLLGAALVGGLDICGVDIALRWLVVARKRLMDQGLPAPLLGASASALPWADGTFDVVVADSVVEHIEEPAMALREWARVLRPGGRLILWSPNRYSVLPDPHVGLWGVGWLPREWARRYVAWRRGCKWPVRPFSAPQARKLAVESGFQHVEIRAPVLGELERTEKPIARLMIGGYRAGMRSGVGRGLLCMMGPLWQLTAITEAA